MKIAFLNIYQDRIKRGGETFVSEISSRLSKSNKVDVISGGNVVIPEWKKSLLWRLFLDKNSLGILKFTLNNLSRIWKEKYGIVIPMNGGWQSVVLRVVTWLYGGKIVIIGQSGNGWHDRINLLTFPNVFVSLTTFASNWAKKANPFVRSVKIPNGVSLENFGLQGETLQLKLEKPIILCVSALVDWKRLDLVIKAVSKIKKGSLLLVGKGDQENKLQKLGDKLLPNRFKILNFEHKDMPKVYRSADLFTFSTVPWESFGIVLVEAMASGLPVVATDDPIRREIVGDAGLFVNPTDTEAYTQALGKALNTDWGDKPRKQAEKFDWDEIALEYEKLFKKL